MAQPKSALKPSQRMRVAYLLTLVGGYLDAYTYIERGGVFANAQTGNIVKLGLSLASPEKELYRTFLVPIAAFALGLITALALAELLDRRGIRLARRSVLVAEMVGLAVVGFVPLGEDWDLLANGIVSFVAAMQYETFTTFRGDAIVTTMSTGNLRKMVDCVFVGILHRDRATALRALRYLSIIVTFCAGAFFGALACGAMGPAAVVPAIALLGAVVATITYLRKDYVRQVGDAA